MPLRYSTLDLYKSLNYDFTTRWKFTIKAGHQQGKSRSVYNLKNMLNFPQTFRYVPTNRLQKKAAPHVLQFEEFGIIAAVVLLSAHRNI